MYLPAFRHCSLKHRDVRLDQKQWDCRKTQHCSCSKSRCPLKLYFNPQARQEFEKRLGMLNVTKPEAHCTPQCNQIIPTLTGMR